MEILRPAQSAKLRNLPVAKWSQIPGAATAKASETASPSWMAANPPATPVRAGLSSPLPPDTTPAAAMASVKVSKYFGNTSGRTQCTPTASAGEPSAILARCGQRQSSATSGGFNERPAKRVKLPVVDNRCPRGPRKSSLPSPLLPSSRAPNRPGFPRNPSNRQQRLPRD